MIYFDKKYFGLIIDKYDATFTLGINLLWIHRHGCCYHYHFIVELGPYFFELRIGRDE